MLASRWPAATGLAAFVQSARRALLEPTGINHLLGSLHQANHRRGSEPSRRPVAFASATWARFEQAIIPLAASRGPGQKNDQPQNVPNLVNQFESG